MDCALVSFSLLSIAFALIMWLLLLGYSYVFHVATYGLSVKVKFKESSMVTTTLLMPTLSLANTLIWVESLTMVPEIGDKMEITGGTTSTNSVLLFTTTATDGTLKKLPASSFILADIKYCSSSVMSVSNVFHM